MVIMVKTPGFVEPAQKWREKVEREEYGVVLLGKCCLSTLCSSRHTFSRGGLHGAAREHSPRGMDKPHSLSLLCFACYLLIIIALAMYVCHRLCAGHGRSVYVRIYGVNVVLCMAPCTDNLCLGRDRGASPRGAFDFVVGSAALTWCH